LLGGITGFLFACRGAVGFAHCGHINGFREIGGVGDGGDTFEDDDVRACAGAGEPLGVHTLLRRVNHRRNGRHYGECAGRFIAALADAAPGRFAIGIGSSSNVIVERWNGVPFVDPYKKVRDVVRFMHEAFSGEKITKEYDTFKVDGFRLSIKPAQKPTILIAALREGMLKLGAREADGVIINWLSAQDVTKVAKVVSDAANGVEKEITARIFVCPSEDTEVVRAGARFAIAAYMNVPVYADFHRWMGRAPLMQGMWDAWKAGDRKAALAAIPDQVVDELVVHGSPAHCRDIISEYFKNGVTTSSLAILPLDPNLDYWKSVEALSPSAS